MTQKEKAKAYDEAIERAKKMFSDKEIVYLFPELKESEDEKIRKSLLEYLHTLPNHYAHSGVCAPEWIAWLEKQGNKVAAIFPESQNSKHEEIRKNLLNLIENIDDKTLNINHLYKTEVRVWLEKQGEPPLTEWSEEDKNFMSDTLGNLIELEDRYGEGYGNVGKCIDWLKSLKNRVQPQKQEWSMYDETILKAIIDHFEYKKEFNEAEDYDIVLWLKSLRPQNTWKPSDEQMETLKFASGGNYVNLGVLESLYQDLKKLREE